MTPADDIVIDGDTAWVVLTDVSMEPFIPCDDLTINARVLDKPCRSCDGSGHATFGNQVRTSERCPDCIDGRHTFTITVRWPDCPPDCIAFHPGRTHRVSVVPGMVEKQEDGTWRVQLKVHQ